LIWLEAVDGVILLPKAKELFKRKKKKKKEKRKEKVNEKKTRQDLSVSLRRQERPGSVTLILTQMNLVDIHC
jgi:hypothetical protein